MHGSWRSKRVQMDMNKIKYAVLWLLMLSMALPFSACVGNPPAPARSEESSGSESAPPDSGTAEPTADTRFPVVKNGKAVPIVYPMDDLDAMGYAKTVANKIKSLTGVDAECREDSRRVDEEADTESYEIFIGAVDNPVCETLRGRIPYGGALVAVEGRKLCVLAMDPDLLGKATLKLLATLTSACDKNTKEILIDGNLSAEIEGTDLLAMVPEFKGKTPAGSYECTANAMQVLFRDVTEAEADGYQSKVLSDGYSLYSGDQTTGKTKSAKNRFLTFRRDRCILTLLYTPSDRILRVLIETTDSSALGWRAEDQTPVEKVCDVTLTQVGLLYDVGSFNGMCYVMRLEDGSFIVTDGGHALQKNADRLYRILRKQAPDPDNIVIAAWIFSHSHGDHSGMFPYFTASYADRVSVERFIYNLPTARQITGDNTAGGNSRITNQVGHYRDAVVTNAHPGQVMLIHGAKIRILYTADLFVPQEISYGNTASMCWTVEAGGVKTMMMGDLGAEVASVMEAIYSDDVFAADVLQVAHHGIRSSPSTLYPKVNPAWALIPLGTGPLSVCEYAEDCIKFVNAAHNRFFFTSEKCRDRVYVANDDILILTFRNGQVADSRLYDTDSVYLNSDMERSAMQ